MLLDEGEYVSAVLMRNMFLEICRDITTSCPQAAMTTNCVILIATLSPKGQQSSNHGVPDFVPYP
jgi:alpha-galactosidase/6-phospho-beta-glucosidase family protein